MTDQEIYNKIVDHLLNMDKPAKSELSCEYETDDGRRCAVGAILPDTDRDGSELPGWFGFHGDVAELLVEYDQLIDLLGLEGASIEFPDEDDYDTDPRAVGRTVDLLMRLQTIHDAPAFWGEWGLNLSAYRNLREVGDDFNLTIPNNLKYNLKEAFNA